MVAKDRTTELTTTNRRHFSRPTVPGRVLIIGIAVFLSNFSSFGFGCGCQGFKANIVKFRLADRLQVQGCKSEQKLSSCSELELALSFCSGSVIPIPIGTK